MAIDVAVLQAKLELDSKLSLLKESIKDFISDKNICPSHGMVHYLAVQKLCAAALESDPVLPARFAHLICCAALLHDLDDKKIFPDSSDYQNLRLMMQSYSAEDVDLVVEMVSYVSSSTNGDTIPARAKSYPWLLWPRYADRLEAVGLVGIARAYQFALTKKGKFYTVDTARALTETDLWDRVATTDRYKAYDGRSLSMIDHYYDKLLRLGMFETQNEFFEKVRLDRLGPMVQVAMQWGLTGTVDTDAMDRLVEELL